MNACSECGAQPAHARGLCRTHYQRMYRGPGLGTFRRRPRAEVIEDVEWLLGWDDPAGIAARVGYESVDSLAGKLIKWGRPDLATRLRATRPGHLRAGTITLKGIVR